MKIKTLILLCLIYQVLQTYGLVQLKNSLATSDSPLLMKILQLVDAATSNEHLLEVTLKLLRSLCVCMRETLKVKEENYLISNSSVEPNESHITDGKVLELYRNIYNNTCINLRQELTNRSQKYIAEEESSFLNQTSCGKDENNKTHITTADSNKALVEQTPLPSRLENVLLKALLETRHLHKYRIKRYNLLGKGAPKTKTAVQHNLIVILTLHPDRQETHSNRYGITEEDLNKTLYSDSPIGIDIIDTKHDQRRKNKDKHEKPDIVSDCNLQSLYIFLTESKQNNLTKVYKFIRKRNTIKMYIEVNTPQNHSDYLNICCENGTATPKCMQDAPIPSNMSNEKNNKTSLLRHYRYTITKIKKLVKLYEIKLNDTKDLDIPVDSFEEGNKNNSNLETTTKVNTSNEEHTSQKENDINKLVLNSTDTTELAEVTKAIVLLNDFVSKQTTQPYLQTVEANQTNTDKAYTEKPPNNTELIENFDLLQPNGTHKFNEINQVKIGVNDTEDESLTTLHHENQNITNNDRILSNNTVRPTTYYKPKRTSNSEYFLTTTGVTAAMISETEKTTIGINLEETISYKDINDSSILEVSEALNNNKQPIAEDIAANLVFVNVLNNTITPTITDFNETISLQIIDQHTESSNTNTQDTSYTFNNTVSNNDETTSNGVSSHTTEIITQPATKYVNEKAYKNDVTPTITNYELISVSLPSSTEFNTKTYFDDESILHGNFMAPELSNDDETIGLTKPITELDHENPFDDNLVKNTTPANTFKITLEPDYVMDSISQSATGFTEGKPSIDFIENITQADIFNNKLTAEFNSDDEAVDLIKASAVLSTIEPSIVDVIDNTTENENEDITITSTSQATLDSNTSTFSNAFNIENTTFAFHFISLDKRESSGESSDSSTPSTTGPRVQEFSDSDIMAPKTPPDELTITPDLDNETTPPINVTTAELTIDDDTDTPIVSKTFNITEEIDYFAETMISTTPSTTDLNITRPVFDDTETTSQLDVFNFITPSDDEIMDFALDDTSFTPDQIPNDDMFVKDFIFDRKNYTSDTDIENLTENVNTLWVTANESQSVSEGHLTSEQTNFPDSNIFESDSEVKTTAEKPEVYLSTVFDLLQSETKIGNTTLSTPVTTENNLNSEEQILSTVTNTPKCLTSETTESTESAKTEHSTNGSKNEFYEKLPKSDEYEAEVTSNLPCEIITINTDKNTDIDNEMDQEISIATEPNTKDIPIDTSVDLIEEAKHLKHIDASMNTTYSDYVTDTAKTSSTLADILDDLQLNHEPINLDTVNNDSNLNKTELESSTTASMPTPLEEYEPTLHEEETDNTKDSIAVTSPTNTEDFNQNIAEILINPNVTNHLVAEDQRNTATDSIVSEIDVQDITMNYSETTTTPEEPFVDFTDFTLPDTDNGTATTIINNYTSNIDALSLASSPSPETTNDTAYHKDTSLKINVSDEKESTLEPSLPVSVNEFNDLLSSEVKETEFTDVNNEMIYDFHTSKPLEELTMSPIQSTLSNTAATEFIQDMNDADKVQFSPDSNNYTSEGILTDDNLQKSTKILDDFLATISENKLITDLKIEDSSLQTTSRFQENTTSVGILKSNETRDITVPEAVPSTEEPFSMNFNETDIFEESQTPMPESLAIYNLLEITTEVTQIENLTASDITQKTESQSTAYDSEMSEQEMSFAKLSSKDSNEILPITTSKENDKDSRNTSLYDISTVTEDDSVIFINLQNTSNSLTSFKDEFNEIENESVTTEPAHDLSSITPSEETKSIYLNSTTNENNNSVIPEELGTTPEIETKETNAITSDNNSIEALHSSTDLMTELLSSHKQSTINLSDESFMTEISTSPISQILYHILPIEDSFTKEDTDFVTTENALNIVEPNDLMTFVKHETTTHDDIETYNSQLAEKQDKTSSSEITSNVLKSTNSLDIQNSTSDLLIDNSTVGTTEEAIITTVKSTNIVNNLTTDNNLVAQTQVVYGSKEETTFSSEPEILNTDINTNSEMQIVTNASTLLLLNPFDNIQSSSEDTTTKTLENISKDVVSTVLTTTESFDTTQSEDRFYTSLSDFPLTTSEATEIYDLNMKDNTTTSGLSDNDNQFIDTSSTVYKNEKEPILDTTESETMQFEPTYDNTLSTMIETEAAATAAASTKNETTIYETKAKTTPLNKLLSSNVAESQEYETSSANIEILPTIPNNLTPLESSKRIKTSKDKVSLNHPVTFELNVRVGIEATQDGIKFTVIGKKAPAHNLSVSQKHQQFATVDDSSRSTIKDIGSNKNNMQETIFKSEFKFQKANQSKISLNKKLKDLVWSNMQWNRKSNYEQPADLARISTILNNLTWNPQPKVDTNLTRNMNNASIVRNAHPLKESVINKTLKVNLTTPYGKNTTNNISIAVPANITTVRHISKIVPGALTQKLAINNFKSMYKKHLKKIKNSMAFNKDDNITAAEVLSKIYDAMKLYPIGEIETQNRSRLNITKTKNITLYETDHMANLNTNTTERIHIKNDTIINASKLRKKKRKASKSRSKKVTAALRKLFKGKKLTKKQLRKLTKKILKKKFTKKNHVMKNKFNITMTNGTNAAADVISSKNSTTLPPGHITQTPSVVNITSLYLNNLAGNTTIPSKNVTHKSKEIQRSKEHVVVKEYQQQMKNLNKTGSIFLSNPRRQFDNSFNDGMLKLESSQIDSPYQAAHKNKDNYEFAEATENIFETKTPSMVTEDNTTMPTTINESEFQTTTFSWNVSTEKMSMSLLSDNNSNTSKSSMLALELNRVNNSTEIMTGKLAIDIDSVDDLIYKLNDVNINNSTLIYNDEIHNKFPKYTVPIPSNQSSASIIPVANKIEDLSKLPLHHFELHTDVELNENLHQPNYSTTEPLLQESVIKMDNGSSDEENSLDSDDISEIKEIGCSRLMKCKNATILASEDMRVTSITAPSTDTYMHTIVSAEDFKTTLLEYDIDNNNIQNLNISNNKKFMKVNDVSDHNVINTTDSSMHNTEKNIHTVKAETSPETLLKEITWKQSTLNESLKPVSQKVSSKSTNLLEGPENTSDNTKHKPSISNFKDVGITYPLDPHTDTTQEALSTITDNTSSQENFDISRKSLDTSLAVEVTEISAAPTKIENSVVQSNSSKDSPFGQISQTLQKEPFSNSNNTMYTAINGNQIELNKTQKRDTLRGITTTMNDLEAEIKVNASDEQFTTSYSNTNQKEVNNSSEKLTSKGSILNSSKSIDAMITSNEEEKHKDVISSDQEILNKYQTEHSNYLTEQLSHDETTEHIKSSEHNINLNHDQLSTMNVNASTQIIPDGAQKITMSILEEHRTTQHEDQTDRHLYVTNKQYYNDISQSEPPMYFSTEKSLLLYGHQYKLRKTTEKPTRLPKIYILDQDTRQIILNRTIETKYSMKSGTDRSTTPLWNLQNADLKITRPNTYTKQKRFQIKSNNNNMRPFSTTNNISSKTQYPNFKANQKVTEMKLYKNSGNNTNHYDAHYPVPFEEIRFRSEQTNPNDNNNDKLSPRVRPKQNSIQIYSSHLHRLQVTVTTSPPTTKNIKYNTYQPTTKEDLELLKYDGVPVIKTPVHSPINPGNIRPQEPTLNNNSCAILKNLRDKFSSKAEFIKILEAANCTKAEQLNLSESYTGKEINKNTREPIEIIKIPHSSEIENNHHPILEININSPQIGTNAGSPPMIEINGNPLPMEIHGPSLPLGVLQSSPQAINLVTKLVPVNQNIPSVMEPNRNLTAMSQNFYKNSGIEIDRNFMPTLLNGNTYSKEDNSNTMLIGMPKTRQNNGNFQNMLPPSALEINQNSQQNRVYGLSSSITSSDHKYFSDAINEPPFISANVDNSAAISDNERYYVPKVNSNLNSQPMYTGGSPTIIENNWNPTLISNSNRNSLATMNTNINSQLVIENNRNPDNDGKLPIIVTNNSNSITDPNKKVIFTNENNKERDQNNQIFINSVSKSPSIIDNTQKPLLVTNNKEKPPPIDDHKNKTPPVFIDNKQGFLSKIENDIKTPKTIDENANLRAKSSDKHSPVIINNTQKLPTLTNNNKSSPFFDENNFSTFIYHSKKSPSGLNKINLPTKTMINNKHPRPLIYENNRKEMNKKLVRNPDDHVITHPKMQTNIISVPILEKRKFPNPAAPVNVPFVRLDNIKTSLPKPGNNRKEHSTSEVKKNSRINIISNIMNKVNAKSESLLDPFEKKNPYPVNKSPVKNLRTPMKRVRIGNRRMAVMTMNTQDFFSQHRFVTAKPPPSIFKPRQSGPKFSVLRPIFRNIDKASRRFGHRSQPVYSKPKDYVVQPVSDNEGWYNKVPVGRSGQPQDMLPVRRPWPTVKPSFLKSQVDSVKDFLFSADRLRVTRRPRFPEVLVAPDEPDAEDNYSPAPFYHRKEHNDQLTTEAARTPRRRRTIFFLSPTVPYNQYV